MPLSEHEQRMLEQMERALYEEDPRFAATIRNTPGPSSRARRGAGVGVLVAALGVVTIIVALLQAIPLLGVLGFVAVLGGTYVALRGVAAEGRPATQRRSTDRSGFLKGAEDRFNQRRDGSPE